MKCRICGKALSLRELYSWVSHSTSDLSCRQCQRVISSYTPLFFLYVLAGVATAVSISNIEAVVSVLTNLGINTSEFGAVILVAVALLVTLFVIAAMWVWANA